MRDEEKSKIYGIKAENYFASILNKFGINHKFVDSWYDFLINKKYKVEVKSCQLTIKDGKSSTKKYRVGRFDFTEKKNRKKQFKGNIWIVFILRHENAFLFLGFVKAKKLNMERYIPLYDLRKLNLISFERWITKINK